MVDLDRRALLWLGQSISISQSNARSWKSTIFGKACQIGRGNWLRDVKIGRETGYGHVVIEICKLLLRSPLKTEHYRNQSPRNLIESKSVFA
jgi:hypothetical protein